MNIVFTSESSYIPPFFIITNVSHTIGNNPNVTEETIMDSTLFGLSIGTAVWIIGVPLVITIALFFWGLRYQPTEDDSTNQPPKR
jgi:hypothetical protein